MIDEEKKANEDVIFSHSGKVDAPAFRRYPDAVISTDTSCPVDESIDFDAVRERLMKMTDDPRMKRIISHMGRITDTTFRRYPDFVVPSIEGA